MFSTANSCLLSCSSYWTLTSVHYIRRDALFYFTLSAYPGLFHLAGFSLCVGPHLLLLSGSISYAVFYTPALSLRLIRLIFGGPARSTSSTAPLHFQENLRRLGHRSRCAVRFNKASPEQPTSRTDRLHRQELPLIFKLRARPPRSD